MAALVTTKEEGAVTHVVINRPDKKNALNRQVVQELTEIFTELESTSATRCVLLYGEGKDAFCAGADLGELQDAEGEEARREFFGGIAGLLEAIHLYPKPVIAKVHGYALAGGCGLAACCDVVLASEDAQFGLPEINLGLLPMIVMAPIERAIGIRATMDMVLSGQNFNALRAVEMGLASRVYPKKELDTKAEKYAERLASKSPRALTLAKSVVYEFHRDSYTEELEALANRSAEISMSDDVAEGIKAFFEKRKPEWND